MNARVTILPQSMESEIKYWSVALVLFVILLMMAGVFSWAFYFNLGEVDFHADRSFSVTVNGDTTACSSSCTLSLPPGSYPVRAEAEGSYSQDLTILITRSETLDQPLTFHPVPYLRPISAEEVSPDEAATIQLIKASSGEQRLVSTDSSAPTPLATFESLVDPSLSCGRILCTIVDEGRVFIIDLLSRRKRRLFDDSVIVSSAQVSQNGQRALLFLELEGIDQVWVWYQQSSQIAPTSLQEPASRLVWFPDSDYEILALSQTLRDTTERSVIEDFVSSITEAEQTWSLYRYNLDTKSAQAIAEFTADQIPLQLLHRQQRSFIEFADGEWQELVTR